MFNKSIPDIVRNQFNQSGAWPVVTGIRNISQGKLVVNDFWTDPNNNVYVTLGLEDGMNAVYLKFLKDGTISSYAITTPSGCYRSNLTELATTKNPRYLMSTLNNANKDGGSRLRNAINYASQAVDDGIKHMVNQFVRGNRPTQENLGMKLDAIDWLVQSYYDTVQKPSTPPDILSEIERAKTYHEVRTDLNSKYHGVCKDMFDREKWLVIYRRYKDDHRPAEVMVGAFDGHGLYMATKRAKTFETNFTLPYTREVQLYKGLDSIDDEIKSEVMGKLAMAKVLRSKLQPNYAHVDNDKLFDQSSYNALSAMNSITYSSEPRTSFMLLDR